MKNHHRPPWNRDFRHDSEFKRHGHLRHENKEKFIFRRFFGPIMGVLFLIILGLIVATVLMKMLPDTNSVLIGVGTLFVLLLLGAISYIEHTVKHVSRPFVEVMSAVDLVGKGDLSVRISEEFPGEFKTLAKSFNRMVKDLEEAEDHRRRLTADVAHELRTPLHILQGNLEGMQDGIYPKDEDQIKILIEEIKILSRLVDDLQTLSLAENKQLLLNVEYIDAGDLLSEATAGFVSQTESLGVTLRVSPSTEQIILHGDRERLGQVIRNLIANALRFTSSGGEIMVTSFTENGLLKIKISDTGIGIAEEDLPYVFDRFWKGDQSRTRQTGVGSGLGLSIAKGIIEMHQGEIMVDSRSNQGTTFIIQLPIEHLAEEN